MKQESFLELHKAEIDKAKIICFDVWDTLLLRPYVQPTDVFSHMQYHFRVDGFDMMRRQAKHDARANHPEWADITLDEIYRFMPASLADFKQKEMDFEAQTIIANPDMLEVWQYVQKAGKPIYVLTDMYLPMSWFDENLKRLGFSGYKRLFLSSEFYDGKMRPKHNGMMYRYVVQQEGFNPSDALMIGDNYRSDVKKAMEAGFKAIFYPRRVEIFLNKNPRLRDFYHRNSRSLFASICCGLFAIREPFKDFWQEAGFMFGGPIAYSFMTWLNSKIAESGEENLLFIARDGYSFKRVFDAIKTTDIKTHYVYANRKQSLLMTLDYIERFRNESEGQHAIRTILDYYRDKDPLLQKETPKTYDLMEGHRFFLAHRSIYEKLAEKELEQYKEYLAGFGKLSSPALCDTLTSFFGAQKLLQLALGTPAIQAYYNFVNDIFIQHPERYFSFSSCCTGTSDLSLIPLQEFFFSAPEKPIQSIRDSKPVYAEASEDEQLRNSVYPSVSDGILAFAILVRQIFKEFSLPSDYQASEDLLRTLRDAPTDDELSHFAGIKHSWSMDHKTYHDILKKKQKKQQLIVVKHSHDRIYYRLFGVFSLLQRKQRGNKVRWSLFGIPFLYIWET